MSPLGSLRFPYIARFKCVFSQAGNDCGPAALATVAHQYGLRLSLRQVTALTERDLEGVALADLASAAERIGFDTRIGVAKHDALALLPLPAIALLDDKISGHYVVIQKVDGDSILIADPAVGMSRCSRDAFLKKWRSRAILLLRPRGTFMVLPEKSVDLTRLVGLISGHARQAVSAMFMACAATVGGFVMSYFVQLIIDKAIPSSNPALLATLGYGALILVTAKSVASFLRRTTVNKLGRRVEFDLRLRYVNALLHLPMRAFSVRFVGDLFSRFVDVAHIRSVLVGTAMSITLDICFLFGCGIGMLLYSPLLTGIIFLCIPLMLILARYSAAAVISSERRSRHAESEAVSAFINVAENLRLIKAYSCEEAMSRRIITAYEKAQEVVAECDRKSGILEGISGFLTAAFTVLLLWIGAHLVQEHVITVGKLMFFFSVAGLLLGAADRILPSIPSVQKALTSLERLDEILESSPEASGKVRLGAEAGRGFSVEVSNVDFWYRCEHPVLRNISVQIGSNETVAIVGETGCGKTTLATLLVSLEPPKAGHIYINGIDIEELDKRAMRRQVNIVFQESGFLNGSILENITLGETAYSMDEVLKASRAAIADDFITSLPRGYESLVGSGGMALSSGQRQRIAIARALLRRPSILILDEATSNLDPETERRLLLSLMSSDQSRTMVFITHRLATARCAERIIVLDRGRIVEVGPHEELLSNKRHYYSLWNAFSGVDSITPNAIKNGQQFKETETIVNT